MPLSEQTIAEMRAGAASVAAHASKDGLDPAYMDAMIRTQQRAKWLRTQEASGKIRTERQTRANTNVKDTDPRGVKFISHTVVFVGTVMFTDEAAEETGGFPSEVLVAQIAMALAAGVGDKKVT